jgi:hypothetical protein
MTTEPNGLLASTNARLAALEEKGAERVKEVAALKDENRRLADALADSGVQLAASQARAAELESTRGAAWNRERDAAREEARQAQARAERAEAECSHEINRCLEQWRTELAASEAECERLRAALREERRLADREGIERIDAALAGAPDAIPSPTSAPPVRDESAKRLAAVRDVLCQVDLDDDPPHEEVAAMITAACAIIDAPRTQEPAPLVSGDTKSYSPAFLRALSEEPTWRSGDEMGYTTERDMDGATAFTLDDGTHVYQAEACPWRGGIAVNVRGDKHNRIVLPWRALLEVAAAAPSEPTRAQPQDEDAAVKWMEEMNECLGGFEKLRYDLQAERDASVRAQVESEIADDCDAQYTAKSGPQMRDQYTEGWLDALDMFERRIRSGAYRKPAAEPTEAERPIAKEKGWTLTKPPTEVVASGPGWSQTRDHRMAEHHAAMKAERPRQQGWDVDDIVSAPAREPQRSEPAALPDRIDGWEWSAKLHGYTLDLDAENNEWRRVYMGKRDHVIVEQQADDDDGLLGVPAAVLRALLREPADTRIARALEPVFAWLDSDYTVVSRSEVKAKLRAILTGAPQGSEAIAALSGDTGGTTP